MTERLIFGLLTPAELLAVVLIVVTVYYAWQNHQMAVEMKASREQATELEARRLREEQVREAVLIDVGRPSTNYGPSTWTLAFKNSSAQPIAGILVRAIAARGVTQIADDPPDGAVQAEVHYPVALEVGGRGEVSIPLVEFLDVAASPHDSRPPNQRLWPERVRFEVWSTGRLSQRILQQYELDIRRMEAGPGAGDPWAFVRLRIQPSVAQAGPLDLLLR